MKKVFTFLWACLEILLCIIVVIMVVADHYRKRKNPDDGWHYYRDYREYHDQKRRDEEQSEQQQIGEISLIPPIGEVNKHIKSQKAMPPLAIAYNVRQKES